MTGQIISHIYHTDFDIATHNQMPINSNDEIKPRLQRQVGVLVAEHLEAKGIIDGIPWLLDRLRVQPPDEPVQSPKHDLSNLMPSVSFLRVGHDVADYQLSTTWRAGHLRLQTEQTTRAAQGLIGYR